MEKRIKTLFACLILFVGVAMAQQKVSGTVLSYEDNEPIVGAAVKVVGTNTGTVTDLNGQFTITCPAGKNTLNISYVGMEPIQVSARANMRILLKNDAQNLDEIVVVAYGTAKKGSLTGSISVVDNKEIEKRITTSVTGALEGAAPGIQVNNTYGEPGKAPTIRIRGFGTLVSGAADPLYVVDGVPFDGNIAEINPADIESMSILKDAASAALYGNRAANGVVLITTKNGRNATKPTITLQMNQGIYNRGIPEYERLGADQWMEMTWKAKKYAMMTNAGMSESEAAAYATANVVRESIGRNIYNGDSDKLFDANGKLIANRLAGYDDLDWEDAIERNGHRQDYTLSAATAGDKYNVYASVGYLKEKGYVKVTDYERFSGRVNTTFTPNKWFKGGVNINGSRTERNYNDNANGNYYANPFYVARYMAPVYPLYMHNADGSYQYDAEGNRIYDTTSSYLSNRNIVYEMQYDKQESIRNVLGGQAFATVMLPYGISFTMKGDVSHSTSNNKKYDNPEIGDGATNNGRLTSYAYQYSTVTLQQIINWNYQFNDVHNVELMAAHESYSWQRKYTAGMNTGMAVDGNLTMGNFLNNSYFLGSDDEDKTESYLARAKYNYADRYFVEASFRRDGSSRFHKDNRWGNFFSLGASWNMKQEKFMKDVDWVNALKLRASYGEVGNNMGVNLYGHMALYTIDKNGGEAALVKKSLSAPDIKWETTQTVDIAVEGTLFNRLNFLIGYFDKRSKDLLFEVRLPLSAGSYPWVDDNMNMTQYKNIGTVSNRGWEISLNGDIIKNKDWRWNLGVDATFLKNKIIKLPDGKDILHGQQNYSEGHSIYEWYTYHYAGVDQMTGTALYDIDPDKKESAEAAGALMTINGVDYATTTSYAKRDWRGSALPTVYGSITSALSWKNFNLNMLFTYSLGGKTYDGSYASLMGVSESGASGNAYHKDILNSWDGAPAGMTENSANRVDPNGTPRADFYKSSDLNGVSDRWLTSSSYFVFKNLNLSYSLPTNWMKSIGLEGITVNAGVENLFTLTSRKGLNPQYSFNGGSDDTYVTARVYNFGLSVKF